MRLMIVGSLGGHISTAGKIALSKGAKVIHTESIEQTLNTLRAGNGADVIMVDVRLKIGDLIDSLESERISIPVVACGVEMDTKSAVNAIRAGAKEYVPLPPDAELIAAILEAVAEETSDMIANDPSMKPVMQLAKQIAPSNATVLITGESGTGKEVMSKHIHNKSKRADKKFISINCAAIPENLLESELFGHEKGAFTGAVSRRIGKFEEANGGTLLLDEISEMPLLMQAKLLRAIQERVIDRVGGSTPVNVDIRLIATSNRDLQSEVKSGKFREDLYFRLNVVNLELPALRNRKSDIEPLAQMFADKYSEHNGVPAKKISAEAIEKLISYKWQGNIRELENTMHRAILISLEPEIEAVAIHINSEKMTESNTKQVANGADTLSDNDIELTNLVGKTVAQVEQELIVNTLDHCLGNRTHAAKILGISIRTLRNKLNLYQESD